MSKDKVIDSLTGIDDDMIQAVEALRRMKRHPVWLKWGVLAACICLVVSITIPILHYKAGPDKQDSVQALAVLLFNGMYYEAVDVPEVLEKYGLPSEITADMAGEHLEYLISDGGAGYECTPIETDIELYQYAPSPCRGVLVLRDGERWYAALFCNFYQFDSNTSVELTELYRVYGIESANDIASITEMSDSNWREIGKPVTDRQEISEFYDMTVALWSYGNDEYQELLYGDIPEEEQPEFHNAVAKDRRNLRIETTTGLRFFIAFYPSYDWIDGGGTMSYFKIDEQMHAWIDRNLN